MRPKLTVHRKGYNRKGNVRVNPATFKIKDRGARGRGKKIIPKLKRGALGVSFKSKQSTRRAKLGKLAKRVGEKKVVGRLRAIQVLNKRTNRAVSRKAKADSKWVAGSFVGKRKVKYPKGFSRR